MDERRTINNGRRFTEKESQELAGKHLFGKVRAWYPTRGYGFLNTTHHLDIMFSDATIRKNERSKISVGSIVEFTVGEYQEKPVAQDVHVIEEHPQGKGFLINQKTIIPYQSIERFMYESGAGICNKHNVTEDILKERGYVFSDLDRIRIQTDSGDITITDFYCPLESTYKENLEEIVKRILIWSTISSDEIHECLKKSRRENGKAKQENQPEPEKEG